MSILPRKNFAEVTAWDAVPLPCVNGLSGRSLLSGEVYRCKGEPSE